MNPKELCAAMNHPPKVSESATQATCLCGAKKYTRVKV